MGLWTNARQRARREFGSARNHKLGLGFFGCGLGPGNEIVVGGQADLSVYLGTLKGQIDFTQLENWPVDARGEIGTCTQWKDGDLSYRIAASGNNFADTGGDAGGITGAFFGARHEGVGGTLVREDLTAAFGGSR